jgi:hypothetical protein
VVTADQPCRPPVRVGSWQKSQRSFVGGIGSPVVGITYISELAQKALEGGRVKNISDLNCLFKGFYVYFMASEMSVGAW